MSRAAAPARANLAGVAVGGNEPVRIVGVVNASPESFYSSSVARGRRALQQAAARLEEEGADIIDVGAMSTAPYRDAHIDEATERERMVQAIRAVREVVRVPVSADTQRARVAAAALDAGAAILNDVTGLRGDSAMAAVARHAGGIILMASEERPGGSGRIGMVRQLLRRSLAIVDRNDIDRERVVVDPGVGFFRRCRRPWHEVDAEILRRLGELGELGRPILIAVSRKSFLGRLTDRSDPGDRLAASLAAAVIAVANGAAAVRTHDVAATRDAVRVTAALR